MPIWWKGRSKGKSKANTKSSASSEWSLRSSTSWGKPPHEQEEGEGSLIPDWLPGERKEKAKSFDGVMLDKKIPELYAATAAVSTGGRVENTRNPSSLGHPLPRPFISLPQPSPLPLEFGVAAAAGSASASSVSSSGSSDDTPDLGVYRPSDPINVVRSRHISHDFQRDEYGTEVRHGISCSPVLNYPKSFDLFLSTRKDIHFSHGFNGAVGTPPGITNSRAVSCAPSVRGSPLSSPTGGHDDLRCPPHPLPLPPSSPSSPSYFSLRTSQMQWKKGKLLGRGTFGHVYLGFNRESGQMCAIKEVKVISDDSNSRESLKQLNQEINLLSQLSRPSIVQYYGSDLVDETLSIYIEYVSGGSIHKLLQEYGPFGEPVIRNYTAQILSGLAYLHGRNTVHRDIKGANILVDPNGEVKLADFGMSKHISSCTSMRSFKGSPYWMAPEVIMNGSGYDLSVDIWSLGCTVLEMATSKPPWSQFEGIAAIFKIWNSKDIPAIPDHLSSEAKSFLKLCLQRDPSARPTACQLMDHPFVCDQAAAKAAKSSMVKETIPSPSGGSYSLVKGSPINASASALCEKDYGLGRRLTGPLAYRSSSDPISTRTNTSLAVSPCSSPLWKYGPPQRSCFPSPAYPTYSSGQDHNGQNNYPTHKTRPNYNFTDPRLDISEFRTRALYERPRG